MNREIKFRAWELNEKKMYEWSYLSLEGDENAVFINNKSRKDDDIILMQYTELKDKNGKEIYEGDIVIGGSYPEQKRIGEIIWKDSAYYKHTKSIKGEKSDYIEPFPFSNGYAQLNEIIGNIYENKDLLKEV